MDNHISALPVQDCSRLDQASKRKFEETAGSRSDMGSMPNGQTNDCKRKRLIDTQLGHRPQRATSSVEEEMKSYYRSPIEDSTVDQQPAFGLCIPATNHSMVSKDDGLFPKTNCNNPEAFSGRHHAGEISGLPVPRALQLSTVPPAPPPNQGSLQEGQAIQSTFCPTERYQEYHLAQHDHSRAPELDYSLDYRGTKADVEYPSVLENHQSSLPNSDRLAWNNDATSFISRRDSSLPTYPGSRGMHGSCYNTVHGFSPGPSVIPGFPQPAMGAPTGSRAGEYRHRSASSGRINDFAPGAVTGAPRSDGYTSDRQLAARHVTPGTISHTGGNLTATEGSRLNNFTSVVRLTDLLSPPPRSPAISSIRGDFSWVEQWPPISAGLAVLAENEAPPHPFFSDAADKQLPSSRDGDYEDLTPDDLLAIPDPEAAKYASQDRVRRSIRPSRPPQFYGTPSMGSGSRIGKKRTPPKRQAQEKLEAALAMAPMPTTSAGPHEQLPGANQEGFSQDLGPDAFGDADADAAAVSDPAPYASQSALSSDYANAPTATVQPIVVPIMLQRNDAVPAPPVVPDIENLETITTEVADWFWPHVVSGEFCDIVEQAKKAGRIHAGYASTVVRRVGDVLLVPQKCDHCIYGNMFCDRQSPCAGCVTVGRDCTHHLTHGLLVRAKPRAVFQFPGLVGKHQPRKPTAMENAAEQKPGPIGQPAVWAENRHAMCECLPYYRAFQSGAYVSGGLCHGLLMDKQAGERDVVSEHVVIARAGGGMTRVDGEFSQTADQTSDSSVVQSMTRNKEQDVPLVLILGSENPKSPTRLPHRYCVMDHFHVTRIWCEKVGSKNTYMFRFQKLDTNRPSWWMGQPQAGLSNRLDSTWQPAEAGCLFCKTVNEQIYTVGWMCLNEKCPAFWSIRRAPTEGPLEYTPEFLMPTAPRNSDNIPTFPLRPPLPRPDEYEMALGFSRACWKGIVCPQCGACNSRVEWAHWHCRTQGCGFVHAIPIRPVGRRVVSQSMDDMFGHALPTARTLPVIEETSSSFDGNYRITVLQLPDCGTIAHVQANHAIITRTGGPDSMFLNLQRSNMGLKRFPLGNSVVSGALTAHFAVNFGMPYKYIVSVDSKSFSEAHPTIMNVLHRLSWAAQKVVHDGSFTEFNELLAVGYFEDQRMNYHDDGEYGLGPTVATMSLGGDAVMSFRMKRTHYTGFSKSGVFKGDGAPVRGCLNYETRKTLYEAGDSLSAQEREEKINELRGGRQGNANPAVTLQLKHGDMVIMHGANIQKYYEHAVHPSGRLRFALTCRHIDPNTVDEGQRWKAAYEHQPWMTYNGDIGAADSRDSI